MARPSRRWAKRQGAVLAVGLALLITGAFGLGTMTPAPAQQAPIGAWEVRHGQLGEEFVFAPNGWGRRTERRRTDMRQRWRPLCTHSLGGGTEKT
jgi:hypothetical protein